MSVSSEADPELEAIRLIISALQKLDKEAQQRALNYAFTRLGIEASGSFDAPPAPSLSATVVEPTALPQHLAKSGQPTDIRTFTENKKPRSANEMAAVVAYYLQYEAPESDRKKSINADDIKKHFHLAKYPAPSEARYTLTNSKNAGYLDNAGAGEYKLNAIGYNLVAHKLPPAGAGSQSDLKSRRSRARSRKK
ncbi:MAG: hypothetical protein AB7T40_16780 [Alphaproteobacteria bacterium]